MKHADRPKDPILRLYRVEFQDGNSTTIEAEHRGAARYYAARAVLWASARTGLPKVKSARLVFSI